MSLEWYCPTRVSIPWPLLKQPSWVALNALIHPNVFYFRHSDILNRRPGEQVFQDQYFFCFLVRPAVNGLD